MDKNGIKYWFPKTAKRKNAYSNAVIGGTLSLVIAIFLWSIAMGIGIAMKVDSRLLMVVAVLIIFWIIWGFRKVISIRTSGAFFFYRDEEGRMIIVDIDQLRKSHISNLITFVKSIRADSKLMNQIYEEVVKSGRFSQYENMVRIRHIKHTAKVKSGVVDGTGEMVLVCEKLAAIRNHITVETGMTDKEEFRFFRINSNYENYEELFNSLVMREREDCQLDEKMETNARRFTIAMPILIVMLVCTTLAHPYFGYLPQVIYFPLLFGSYVMVVAVLTFYLYSKGR